VGGNRLNGAIDISCAKNAVLPLMIASLLTEEEVTLENVPKLRDVTTLRKILEHHGVDCRTGTEDIEPTKTRNRISRSLTLSAPTITSNVAPYELVSKMRASFWVISPLLARCGEARVSLPGGCAIGTRPVNFITDSLERLGAEVRIDGGYVVAKTLKGLRGTAIDMPKPSVGTTHSIMMAATLARGETTIKNAAQEPEIMDLANCLNSMGAKIEGAGTSTIRIYGVERLRGTTHRVMPDRIEAGTYAMAAAITGGDLLLRRVPEELLSGVIEVLRMAGADIECTSDSIRVTCDKTELIPCDITTAPFPGFPTDLQAQFTAMMTQAEGSSLITESIFENRFMHVSELCRLGAKITLKGQVAKVEGKTHLVGAPVMATDLRASVSLILAALVSEGTTTISRVYHLDRGFEDLEYKLSRCGAIIERITDSEIE